MSSRIYEKATDKQFDVYFTDEKGREFKRVVWAPTSEHAVAKSMTDDRAAGGCFISFLRYVEYP